MALMLRGALAATTISLGLGFVIGPDEQWVMVFVVGIVAAAWLAGVGSNRHSLADVGLVAFIVLAAVGLYFDRPALLMLLASVAALVTWDLDRFSRRLAQADRIESERASRWVHGQRLVLTAGAGLLLGIVALIVALPLSFGWAVGLALVAVVSLSWVVGSLRRNQ